MQIVWFKRDLRVFDQPALAAASQLGRCMGIYIFEPQLWKQPDLSSRHFQFLNDCLVTLQQDLARLNIECQIFVGHVTDVLKTLYNQFGHFKLFSCQETWNHWTYDRDIMVKKWCLSHQVQWQELPQNGVIRGLKCRDGWSKSWHSFMTQPLLNAPSPQLTPVTMHTLPQPSDLGIQINPSLTIQKGGTCHGIQCLDSFLNTRGEYYTTAMSSPVTAFEACSRLSPHIAFGSLSIRQIYQQAKAANNHFSNQSKTMSQSRWKRAFRSFLSRLQWHCHFIQKLEDDPLIEFRALHSLYRPFDNKDGSKEAYERWTKGLTGYPLIDACMRALHQTGWLNFRMRAMVMSFGAHHLQLPWRQCALYLATQFTDYEPGIHYSQCQMQSGVTGINTIRIYNPIKQSYDQDPNGLFIRKWCPELEKIPQSGIHEPWHYGAMQPIVDDANARKFAADRLYRIRKDARFATESKSIQHKHGSRRVHLPKKGANQLPLNFGGLP